MSIPLLLFFSAWLLFEFRVREEQIRPLYPECAHCRYDLKGLPDTGLCPECGERYLPTRPVRQVEHFVYRRGTVGYWLVCVALAAAFEYWEVGQLLFAWGTIQSYLDDGYRLDVATNAAWKRDLARGGAYFGQWVGSWWIGCTPIIGLMCRGWKRYAALVVGTTIAMSTVILLGF